MLKQYRISVKNNEQAFVEILNGENIKEALENFFWAHSGFVYKDVKSIEEFHTDSVTLTKNEAKGLYFNLYTTWLNRNNYYEETRTALEKIRERFGLEAIV